ncbi:hypothetical protein NGRA_2455 [Nosema granulosis]|uniref:Uncharacterized protein n=1 Tax=Nosema granulosis TaxID=83296 RepID=A0A9P6KXP5_9MICR|nr:hypothetical protein NGRA_2455 [Nosema granulosis]
MRRGTTSNTPFVLFFGPSIQDLMQEDYLSMVIEDSIREIDEAEEENIEVVEPVDILDLGNFEFLDQEWIEDDNLPIDIQNTTLNDQLCNIRDSTQRAADRMVAQ